MEDLHKAGGLMALLAGLREQLDLAAPSASGRSLGEEIDAARADDSLGVIRAAHNPVSPAGAIAVLDGNLAPDTALIKHAAASPELLQHEGPALVFDSLEDLARRIDDETLAVTAEHVLVLRNAGPKGAPGMPEAGYIPIPRRLARAGVRDMVRISDARMSGTAYGTVVLHVAPEAAEGGPLALVRDGDMIELDVEARRLHLDVPDEELARRRESWQPPPAPERGYARIYHDHVLQADRGCDFDFLVGASGAPVPRESH